MRQWAWAKAMLLLVENHQFMNRVIAHLAIVLSLFLITKVSAQDWEVVTSLPQTEFTVAKALEGKIYAAAQHKLYISTDGMTWQSENIHPVPITPTCITLFNGVLYVGTLDDGIYFRNIAPGSPWNHAVMGLHISHFAVHDGRLHFCSQGSGVWRNISGTWNNMTYDLPIYSYNVTKIISLDGKLYALAGANGTFYRYNPAVNKWIEDYYFNNYLPGLMVDDALTDGSAILAANGNRLLRTDDAADTWIQDNVGMQNGVNRILYKGMHSIYALTLDGNTNFTYLQKRSINAPSQTTWANNELLEFYSYAIDEFAGRIYIASNQGVYVKPDSTLGVGNPVLDRPEIVLFPSPSPDGNINISSSDEIGTVTAYNLSGQMVLSRTFSTPTATINIPQKGIFLVRVTNGDQSTVQKVVVQ